MDTNTGRFKVGDRVYVIGYGYGVVTGKGSASYSIMLDTKILTYADHKGCPFNGTEQVVFHDKPTIIPPKRKIKKWLIAYQIVSDNTNQISTQYYSEKQINHLSHPERVMKLPWTEIEVEESTPVYEELLMDPRN